MRKKLLAAITVFILLFSGCSSVSQEDYDAKIKELETAQKELETSKTELETVKNDLESVKKEYADYKQQYVDAELKKAGAVAWVQESFGTEAQAIVNGNDLYVNIPIGFTISQKSINSLMTTLLSSLSLYSTYYATNPEQLPYDSVTVIILDEETKFDMMSLQLLANGKFENNVMLNMDNITKLLTYVDNAVR